MKPFNRKVTLGLVVSSRAFFNSAYAPNCPRRPDRRL